MKKIITLLLVLVFSMAFFTACGGSDKNTSSNDPNVGTWIGVSVDTLGYATDITDVYPKGATVELKANGNVTLTFNSDKTNGKWTAVGNNINITCGGVDYPSTIDNGVLSVELLQDMYVIYTRDGNPPPAKANTTTDADVPENNDEGDDVGSTFIVEDDDDPLQTNDDIDEVDGSDIDDNNVDVDVEDVVEPDTGDLLADTLAWWVGDWYGSFYISGTSEAYDEIDGNFEDAYAVIKATEGNKVFVYLWTDNYDLGTIELEIEPSAGSKEGSAMSVGGNLFGEDVENGDWTLYPIFSRYDDTIEVYEMFTDTDGDYFAYEIIMRPWGMDWDAIDYEDQPMYYEDWYLDVCGDPMLDVLSSLDLPIHEELSVG